MQSDDGKGASALRLTVWLAAFDLLAIAVPTWKFGLKFLGQFFISPFQFFIVVPWGFAFYGLWAGTMPMRSGPSLERAKSPGAFWTSVWFSIVMGALCFAMNLIISWVVVSRPQR